MNRIASPAPLLPEILALHGKWRAGKEALVCGDQRLTWGAFIRRCNQVANGLLALGLGRGDRVVVLMCNSPEMVEVLFGIMTAGCVSVPLNLAVDDRALAAMIDDCAPGAVICSADQLSRLQHRSGDGICYITCGPAPAGWQQYDQLFASQPDTAPAVDIGDDDLLNIIYSSGTTGLPKGIAHTFCGRRDWAYDLAVALRYHGGARTLVTIGLYSNISWVAMLTTLLAGGTLVVQRRFEVADFWRDLEEERITHTAMVPIQYQRILDYPALAEVDTSRMQSLMSCGSPLHEGLKRRLFEVFTCGIIELYGLTEGIITTLEPEEVEGHWQSVGKPLIGTDIAILDDKDRCLAAGESGEIVSRGRITMPCYFNRPEATEEVRWVDGEGRQWLRSGDIGYLDQEGYLYIVDRKKDMILSGGQNIYPQDIEAVLIEHPEVDDVAVIAAPSQRWGETPIALVVPRGGHLEDIAGLLAWCNARVGRQQRIADLIVVSELPRNPNGKILKRELRKSHGQQTYP